MKHVVRSLGMLEDGGVIVEYVTPAEDVATNGLIINHSLMIPPIDAVEDELLAVISAVQILVVTALELMASTSRVDVASMIDDDGPSPYDNPADGGSA